MIIIIPKKGKINRLLAEYDVTYHKRKRNNVDKNKCRRKCRQIQPGHHPVRKAYNRLFLFVDNAYGRKTYKA